MPQDTGLGGFLGLMGETGLLCPGNQPSGGKRALTENRPYISAEFFFPFSGSNAYWGSGLVS